MDGLVITVPPASLGAIQAASLARWLLAVQRITTARQHRISTRGLAVLSLLMAERTVSKRAIAAHLRVDSNQAGMLLGSLESRHLLHTRREGTQVVATITWEGEAVVRKLIEVLS